MRISVHPSLSRWRASVNKKTNALSHRASVVNQCTTARQLCRVAYITRLSTIWSTCQMIWQPHQYVAKSCGVCSKMVIVESYYCLLTECSACVNSKSTFGGDRTHGQQLKRLSLYRLSYEGHMTWKNEQRSTYLTTDVVYTWLSYKCHLKCL